MKFNIIPKREKGYSIIIVLSIIILLQSCSKEQCWESHFFRFQTENSLERETIRLGNSFNITVDFPNSKIPKDDVNALDISGLSFLTAITFKEYDDPSFEKGLHEPAMDKFEIEILEGNEAEFKTPFTAYDTGTHSIFLEPENKSSSRKLSINIKPTIPGVFFIYFQSATFNIRSDLNLDEDDCLEHIFFDFENSTKNNYDFLEGEIQNNSNGGFLENWSGIAFVVTN